MGVDWSLANKNQYDYLDSLQQAGQASLAQSQAATSRYRLQTDQRQDAARPAILAKARTGDFQGAAGDAFVGGDKGAYDFVAGLQSDQREQFKQHVQAIGGMAANLANLPAEQRKAALMAAAPQLVKLGITPEEINSADVSDAGLRGYIGAAQTSDAAIKAWEESQKPLTVADGAQVFGATPMGGGVRPLIADNPKEIAPQRPVWDSERGGWVYPPSAGAPTGSITTMGGGGQPSGGGAGRYSYGWTPRARNGGDNPDNVVDNKIGGMATALGVGPDDSLSGKSPMEIARALTLSEGGAGSLADRNNNPGNLTDPKTGQFRKFPTKEAGLAAAAGQVARNLKRGQTTIRTMVEGLPAGGAPQSQPGPGGGFVPVVAPKNKQYRILSPQEAQDRGLDASSRWQIGPNDQITSLPSKGDKPLTESQGKATGYLERAVAAADALNGIPNAPKPDEVNASLYGMSNANPLRRNMSPLARQALSAQEAFVMAILRQDSGAAISAGEIQSGMRTYFPQPGDDAATQANKRKQREAAIRGLRTAAGPGAASVRGAVAPGAGAKANGAKFLGFK